MPVIKYQSDMQQANTFLHGLAALQKSLNTPRHLNANSRAVFEILSEEFNNQTDARAIAMKETLHHVYEPNKIGVPAMRLWQNELKGRGGVRQISWKWKASKQVIDPKLTYTGEQRFPNPPPGFNANKLSKIHVFVWKAPIMEYGTSVEVSPKLSTKLVFPNPNLLSTGSTQKVRSVMFTSRTQRSVPGRELQGNFTKWFAFWWGGPMSSKIIAERFSPQRDAKFVEEFKKANARAGIGKPIMRVTVNTNSPAKGKAYADAIAKGMEHNYIEMARRRKMRNV